MEDFLFCAALEGRTTSDEIFSAFMSATSDMDLDWNKCVGICTDGARNMTGRTSGYVRKFSAIAPNAEWTHCFIHRQALACKSMPIELKNVMDSCVQVVNFIKDRATNSRLFKLMCEGTDADHHQLLFHTEARWLSRGNMLERLYSLREEVRLFLLEQKQIYLGQLFHQNGCGAYIAYLSDIFAHINVLNATLQTPTMNQITAKQRLHAFKGRDPQLVCLMAHHLRQLQDQFDDNLPSEDLTDDTGVENPFYVDVHRMPDKLSASEKESLIEVSCDNLLRSIHHQEGTSAMWTAAVVPYESLAMKALKKLVPFATSYLCESAFSHMVFVKTKGRSRLTNENLEAQLRIKVSRIEPKSSLRMFSNNHRIKSLSQFV
ncbi:zinc finger BED domain-containing protein 5-like [Galendromus occidentalis]|uniref:Zinc finger BED domain-containing protein 5-like n=1 Tax=Galendromus occidentalis TaxID=34638 RepID=A0AAJ6QXV2_9ACAR|nr:zinc finger BED domain-containing protein 5-like [Galendromus occidentalis]